jgi:hypothetical protein
MIILVCGDRNWSNQRRLNEVLDNIHSKNPIHRLIEGEAKGADSMGRIWGMANSVPVEPHPANWKLYGRAAGPIRNAQMLKSKPDLVVAFHNDFENSKGTRNMVKIAKKADIKVMLATDTTLRFITN